MLSLLLFLLPLPAFSYLNIALHSQSYSPLHKWIAGSEVTTNGMAKALSRSKVVSNVRIFSPFVYDGLETSVKWDVAIIEGYIGTVPRFIADLRASNPNIVILHFCVDTFPHLKVIGGLDVDGYLTNSVPVQAHLSDDLSFGSKVLKLDLAVDPAPFRPEEEEDLRLVSSNTPLGSAAGAADADPANPAAAANLYVGIDVVYVGQYKDTKRGLVSYLTEASDFCLSANCTFVIYGNGWLQNLQYVDPSSGLPLRPLVEKHYRGVLPLSDLSLVYKSVPVILGTTESLQESLGMINNRVFEALAAGATLIIPDFPALHALFEDIIVPIDDKTSSYYYAPFSLPTSRRGSLRLLNEPGDCLRHLSAAFRSSSSSSSSSAAAAAASVSPSASIPPVVVGGRRLVSSRHSWDVRMSSLLSFLEVEFGTHLREARVNKGFWTFDPSSGELSRNEGTQNKAPRPNRPVVTVLTVNEDPYTAWWYSALNSMAMSGAIAFDVAVVPSGNFEYTAVLSSYKRDISLLLIDSPYDAGPSLSARSGAFDRLTLCDSASSARATTATVIRQVLSDRENCEVRRLVQRRGILLRSDDAAAFEQEGGGIPDDLVVYDVVISPRRDDCSAAVGVPCPASPLSPLIQRISSHFSLPASSPLDLPTSLDASSLLLSLTLGRPIRRASVTFEYLKTSLGSNDENNVALLPPLSTLSPIAGRGVGGDWVVTLVLSLYYFRPPDDGYYCVEYEGEGGDLYTCGGDLNQSGTVDPADSERILVPVHVDASAVWGRENEDEPGEEPRRTQKLYFRLVLWGGNLESPRRIYESPEGSARLMTTT